MVPHDHRFLRTRRLLTKKDFDRVFREGRKSVRSSLIVFLRVRGGDEEAEPRLGLAVSRKVGKAVVRNRVRRRIRESFRLHFAALPRPADVVVVARPEAAMAGFVQLEADYLAAIEQLVRRGLFDESPGDS